VAGRVAAAEVRLDFDDAADEESAAEAAEKEFAGEIPRDGERAAKVK
jgi:hypothetical protein